MDSCFIDVDDVSHLWISIEKESLRQKSLLLSQKSNGFDAVAFCMFTIVLIK